MASTSTNFVLAPTRATYSWSNGRHIVMRNVCSNGALVLVANGVILLCWLVASKFVVERFKFVEDFDSPPFDPVTKARKQNDRNETWSFAAAAAASIPTIFVFLSQQSIECWKSISDDVTHAQRLISSNVCALNEWLAALGAACWADSKPRKKNEKVRD